MHLFRLMQPPGQKAVAINPAYVVSVVGDINDSNASHVIMATGHTYKIELTVYDFIQKLKEFLK